MCIRLAELFSKKIKHTIDPEQIIENPTPTGVYNLLCKKKHALTKPLLILKKGCLDNPLFLFHPVTGGITCYMELSKSLNFAPAIIGVKYNAELSFDSFASLAEYYVERILTVQQKGPFFLAGSSLGGNIAVEVATQLIAKGESVAFLGLFDSWAKFPGFFSNKSLCLELYKKKFPEIFASSLSTTAPGYDFLEIIENNIALIKAHSIKKVCCKVVLIKAAEVLPEYAEIDIESNHWHDYCPDLDIIYSPGDHFSMLELNKVSAVAKILEDYMHCL